MNEAEREKLLKRVRQQTSTVGHRLPETITIDGTEMHLREFVFETKRQGAVPPAERERVKRVRRKLKRERDERERRLQEEELTREEGEELANTIIGIDRALNALKNLVYDDYSAQTRQRQVEDAKRWVGFIDNILGK